MTKFLCGLALALVLAVAGHAQPAENDPAVARTLEIVNDRLDPAHRDRVLKLFAETRDRPEARQKLMESLESFEKKMQPGWTGLLIGGGVVTLASGVGAGMLAAKLGAAGMVAGPIGAVAGLATGALVGYAIHKYHQRKAVSGGVFSRTGRKMGFAGKGLTGDLIRLEKELAKPSPAPAPAASPAAPAAPKKHWYDRFRRTKPAASPAPAPVAPALVVPPAPAAPPAIRAARGDDPNTDDVNVGN